MTTLPAPIQVQPSSDFDASIDGPWSTFTITVGKPPQEVRVLVSNTIAETWVVSPDGCTVKSVFDNCPQTRGETFNNETSTTWQKIANGVPYTLSKDDNLLTAKPETRLGYYGYDSIGITGVRNSGTIQSDQVIAQIQTNDFYMGYLGLLEKTPGVAGQTKPSLLRSLYNDKKIPSLSYSYTAGAVYRKQQASLTLGGQDTSRFEPNSVNFTMAQDEQRPLVVGLQSVTLGSQDSDETSPLLTDGIMTVVDSTLPNIWIPTQDCQKWVDAFGLNYNSLTLMYNINATQHAKNLEKNATITFALGTDVEGGDTAKIVFPYSAFELNFTNPGVTNPKTTLYFPLRQADDPQEFVLGRSFLQNAYLSVNYDWKNFSISQAVAGANGDSHIVPLPVWSQEAAEAQPPSGTGSATPGSTDISVVDKDSGGGGGFPMAAIAGIVIPILLIAGGLIWFFCFRRRRRDNDRGLVVEPMVQTPMPPEMQGDQSGAFTTMATKSVNQPSDYFSQPTSPRKPAPTATATELPSPPVQFGAIPSPHSNIAGAAHSDNTNHPVELAGSPASHELSAPRATMSQGPSPSLSPVPASAIGQQSNHNTSNQQPWADHSAAAFDPASPRPSLLSANSIPIQSANGARLVSHSRGGSSPHGSGLGPGMGMSPTSLGPYDEHEHDVGGALGRSSSSGGNGNGGSSGANGLRRGGSHRSQASEGTLVNAPTEGGPSPVMRGIGEDDSEEHGHGGLSAFVSPVLSARSFAQTREGIERGERERMVSPEPLTTPDRLDQ